MPIQVVYEMEKHSLQEWMEVFSISEQEFNQLVFEGILYEFEANMFRNLYVGAIKFRQSIFYSIPKCFISGNIPHEKSLKYIISLTEKVLIRYNERIKRNKSII